jgi:transketolase
MRNAFADEITQIAKSDSSVVLLSGDIGNRLFDKYKESNPDRFINCGVAEANMISMSSGLAMSGMKPVAYTIASFLIYRAFEQIRVDLSYHDAAVLLVGVGGGLSYASNGSTHHTLEDIALKPTYLRIGKKGEDLVHKNTLDDFKVGRSICLKHGRSVALLATGNILANCLSVTEELEESGISTSLYSFHTVKPLDKECLGEIFERHKHVITVEEHGKIGGFGSAVAEWFSSESRATAKLLTLGTPDKFLLYTGNQKEAQKMCRLDKSGLLKQIVNFIGPA